MLGRALQHKLLASVDLDDGARMQVHAEILKQKPMLKEVFTEFHKIMLGLDGKHLDQTGSTFPIKRTFDDRTGSRCVSHQAHFRR